MQRLSVVRPRHQLAPPCLLDAAFADPDAVIALIRRGSPYRKLAAVHRNMGETSGGWFRNFWALGGKVVFDGAAPFFHNPRFIDAAREAFRADIIRPVAMMTNLNLPMAGLPPHQDLPFFRGAQNREVPSWMLAPMGYSGLFHDWAVPVASALTWFYDGEGGEFEYWPDGLEAPSRTLRPPFSNRCLLADNEYMFHRVGPVGPEDEHDRFVNLGHDARLILTVRETWQVEDGGQIIAELEFAKVRLSVLWKVYCFRNEAEARGYDDHSSDLTPALVKEIFLSDLAARGIQFRPPVDIWTDPEWKETITRVYGPPSGY